jgi:predicted nucleic acid-binding protein
VAEIWYTFAREGTSAEADEAVAELRQLGVAFVDVTVDLALEGAKFKAQHKLSLADAFAAALAKQQEMPVVTGDPEFEGLPKSVKIWWLNKPA